MDVERGMGVRLSLWEENEARFNVKSKWRTAHGFKDVNSSCCFDGFALSQCGEAEAAQPRPGVFLCLKENKLFALQLCWKKHELQLQGAQPGADQFLVLLFCLSSATMLYFVHQ